MCKVSILCILEYYKQHQNNQSLKRTHKTIWVWIFVSSYSFNYLLNFFLSLFKFQSFSESILVTMKDFPMKTLSLDFKMYWLKFVHRISYNYCNVMLPRFSEKEKIEFSFLMFYIFAFSLYQVSQELSYSIY